MQRRRLLLMTAGSVLLPAALAGCGPRNYLNDNDRLREENLALSREVGRLEAQLQDRLGEIESLRAASRDDTQLSGVDPPIPSGLDIDRYSGPIDTDGDGVDDVIRLYLLPTDQHGRMIPVAGTLTAALLHVPDEGDPAVLIERHFEPAELDAAYRDGFTGPYYRCEFDLAEVAITAPPTDELTVRCVLRPAGAAALRAQAHYRVRITAPDPE